MSRDSLCVLTPVWNGQATIVQAVLSILQQSYARFTYVIIDDDSTDLTWPLLQRLATYDSRLKIFRNRCHLGVAATRNLCLQRAKSTYIAWQDADDVSYPDRLQTQLHFLQTHLKVGIVGASLDFFSTEKTESARRYPADDATLRRQIFHISPVAQPVAMIRRSYLDQVGRYNEALTAAEDLDMSFRLGAVSEFANISHSLLRYRMTPQSATRQQLRTMAINSFRIRWHNRSNPAYHFQVRDLMWMIMSVSFSILFPTSLTIALFNRWRNRSSAAR